MRGDPVQESAEDLNELNPFWMKFLQPEKHYGISSEAIAPTIEKALINIVEEESKQKVDKKDLKSKEYQKIMAMEKQLADLNRKQREFQALHAPKFAE